MVALFRAAVFKHVQGGGHGGCTVLCSSVKTLLKVEVMEVAMFHAAVLKHVEGGGHGSCTVPCCMQY